MGSQHERILSMLRSAGDKGLHSKDFMESYLPTFSQRIGELRMRGYAIRSVREKFPSPNSVATGKRYFLEGEPPKPEVTIRPVPVPESREVSDQSGRVEFDRLFTPPPARRYGDAA